MKKYISLLLCALILCLSFSAPIYAADDNATPSDNVLEEALSYTCIYDIESKRVKVSGTMNSEIFRDYSDWTLCVFKLSFGQSESDIISDLESEPIAETMVSIKFDFSFKAEDVADRYSRYAIFLRSPQDEYLLATEAQYPEVTYSASGTDTNRYFKGVAGEFSSLITEIEPGSAIIDVDLNSVFSDTSTSLFIFVDNKQYFFSESVISSLDLSVRSMSVSGTKVYLRFVLSDENFEQVLPDIYDDQVLLKMHSLVTFLIERYSQYYTGNISGIILGKQADYSSKLSVLGEMTLEEYVDRCISYTVVTANSSRTIDPSVDIVLPLGADAFIEEAPENSEQNLFMTFIETFLAKLDQSFHSGMEFSFLLECKDAPISGELAQSSTEEEMLRFDADAQKEFSQYMQSLEHSYRSMPSRYMLLWTPSYDLNGKRLAATYTYCYYSLLGDSKVSVFAIDMSDEVIEKNLRNISHTVKYIDTYEGKEATKNLPSVFDKKNWDELIGKKIASMAAVRHCYSVEAEVDSKNEFMGEFKYFDFTASGILESWYAGSGCSSLKINHSDGNDKALKAEFDLGDIYEYGEFLYVAEYSENMVYTPTLRFKLTVEGDSSLYEVKIRVGNSDNHIESSAIVSSDKISEIFVDISQYISSDMVDYLRISVRSLEGGDEKCNLLIYDICGLSASYNSEELESLIMSERDKIRHSDESEEERKYWTRIAMGMGIVLLIGALGTGLFVSFRKDDNDDVSQRDEE